MTPTTPRTPRTPARPLLAAVAALGLACASWRPPATPLERDAYLAMRGALVRAETTRVGTRGRYALYRVRLASSTGLAATGRLLRPDGPAGGALPAVLLDDGRELDSRAVEALPAEFGDVVVLSLDYPPELPYTIDLGAVVAQRDRLRRTVRRIPALFSLGGAYLAARADVDAARVALVATSFAVPFATIAAAADTTFRNVALVYGAGDFPTVIAANVRLRPAWLRRPLARVVLAPFADLEPARFVGAIAPRPLVMINSRDDPQIPASAVAALYAAAREPKTLVTLRTGHLMPDDSVLVRALVDSALAHLPVLRAPPAPRRVAP
jgi:hypothetical protein